MPSQPSKIGNPTGSIVYVILKLSISTCLDLVSRRLPGILGRDRSRVADCSGIGDDKVAI